MDINLLVNPDDAEHSQLSLHDEMARTERRRCSYAVDIDSRASKSRKFSTDSDSDISMVMSRRSTITSTTSTSSYDEDSPPPNVKPPTNYQSFIEVVKTNTRYPVHLDKITLVDNTIDCNNRDAIVSALHERYVQPLLPLTGYKWVRKDGPGKKHGVKTFTMKYVCSQQKPLQSSRRCRQLSHPLKEFDCSSYYCIKYQPATSTVELIYHHQCHLPYKFLPDNVKAYISERLDQKAQDLYHEIIHLLQFSDVKHLIYLTKVQSYWSKERLKKRNESTKQAFKTFLSKKDTEDTIQT